MAYRSAATTEITLRDGTRKMVPIYASGAEPPLTDAEREHLPDSMRHADHVRFSYDYFDRREDRQDAWKRQRELLAAECAEIARELAA